MTIKLELAEPVLVVDDLNATRYSTRRILIAAGAQVIEAVNGAQALELAPQCGAIVLDINLPDTDGFEVGRLLRAADSTRHIPLIFLSAQYLQDEDRTRGLQAGGDAYLTHPVDPGVLVATINALLRVRRAEQANARSIARFQAVFEAAPVGIAIVSPELSLGEANSEFGRIFGLPRDALSGHPLTELGSLDLQRVAAVSERSALSDTWETSAPDPRSPGSSMHLECRVAPAGGENTVVLVSDVTRKHNLELERELLLARERIAREDAEQANAAKDVFLATLSHELRNPLNTISVWAQLLRSERGQAFLGEGLDAIVRSVSLQVKLVDDLLDVSRIATGKLSLQGQVIAPCTIIDDVVLALRGDLEARQIRLETRLDPAVQIVADAARLHQVIWNLVSNAVKFSEAGGAVSLVLQRDGDLAAMVISDQGAGIEPEFLPYLFDRFRQGESGSTRLHGGLGLGLSIAKSLVELQGGTITAQSAGRGQGARFEIRFPLARGQQDAASTFSAEAHPGAQPLKDRVILLVEDSVESRRTVSLILEHYGATVLSCASAISALQALEQMQPHIILSDLGMPGMDGFQFMEEVRRRQGPGRPVPAVAVSAYASKDDVARSIEAGFQAHLAKPISIKSLLAVIDSVLVAQAS